MRQGVLLVTVIFAGACASEHNKLFHEPREADVVVEEDGIEPEHGSTYRRNCKCSYSTMWCAIRSDVKDHGVCC